MANTKAIVDGKIASKKVFVFSKTYCPFCSMAKNVLCKYVGKDLDPADYEVWEIENEANCGEIQAALKDITGASTVPRVFIKGKCIGGGSETQALDNSGELEKMLKS